MVHLVHSPSTCIGASWETRQTLTSHKGQNNTVTGYTTDVMTNDVIFGGDKKLEESINYIVENRFHQDLRGFLDNYKPLNLFLVRSYKYPLPYKSK